MRKTIRYFKISSKRHRLWLRSCNDVVAWSVRKPSKPPNISGRSHKPYFSNGHRKPSQNRSVVNGGLFSNHKVRFKESPRLPFNTSATDRNPSDLHKWNPDSPTIQSSSDRISPITKFILDAFRKNQNHWGLSVVPELNKLRRIRPNIVSDVLKAENDVTIASKFFHWAGKQKGYKHDYASYNAFAYCLNRTGHFRAADQLPELMKSQGRTPSEKQFEILIRMDSDKKRGLRVYYVYEKMKKFGIKPRVFLYNRIMDSLRKT